MIDTWSNEWRRITEARWVLRECNDQLVYLDGVRKFRGDRAHNELAADVMMVRPHMANFTKRAAAELIVKMKEQDE